MRYRLQSLDRSERRRANSALLIRPPASILFLAAGSILAQPSENVSPQTKRATASATQIFVSPSSPS